MRYVRILLLVVVGMVPAMRSGFSAQMESPQEIARKALVTFGMSPAAPADEALRAALRVAVQKGEVGEVEKLLAPLPNDAERARCVGLYVASANTTVDMVSAWRSAAHRLKSDVLTLFVPFLNHDAKNYALLDAAAPEPKDDAGQIAQQAIFRLLLDAGADGEAAARSWDTQANAAQGEDAVTKKRHAQRIRDAVAAQGNAFNAMDRYDMSPAMGVDEPIRQALRAAVETGKVEEVRPLLQGLTERAIQRRIGLYKVGDVDRVTAWRSAATNWNVGALGLFILNLNQNAKDYALTDAVFRAPAGRAQVEAQRATLRRLFDAGANGEEAAEKCKSVDDQLLANRIRAAMAELKKDEEKKEEEVKLPAYPDTMTIDELAKELGGEIQKLINGCNSWGVSSIYDILSESPEPVFIRFVKNAEQQRLPKIAACNKLTDEHVTNGRIDLLKKAFETVLRLGNVAPNYSARKLLGIKPLWRCQTCKTMNAETRWKCTKCDGLREPFIQIFRRYSAPELGFRAKKNLRQLLMDQFRVLAKDDECGICLRPFMAGPPDAILYKDFDVFVTRCGHFFHRICLPPNVQSLEPGEHVPDGFKCPICRSEEDPLVLDFKFQTKATVKEQNVEESKGAEPQLDQSVFSCVMCGKKFGINSQLGTCPDCGTGLGIIIRQ
jgi:hypothetical protein